MLVTRQPVLRRFWYAVMPLDRLDAGPQPFTLLGEKIVLWKGSDGAPVALRGIELITVRDGRLALKDVFWKQARSPV